MLNSIIPTISNISSENHSHIPDTPRHTSISAKANTIGADRFHTNNPIKANLRKLGFKEAGKHEGSAESLRVLLQRVYQGIIIDKDTRIEDMKKYKDNLDRKIEKLDKEIKGHQEEILKKETTNTTITNVDIPLLEKEIEELKKSREKKELEILEEQDKKKENKFDKLFYWIIFAFSSIYIYLFYVAASYSALFRKMNTSNADINSLFESVFTSAAFTELNFHWLVPLVFVSLGALFHLSLESDGLKKVIYSSLVVTAILLADGLLAYFVELKAMEIKYMTGMVDDPSYSLFGDALYDPMFYLILVLGSLTCIVWSFIYMKVRSYYSDLTGFKAVRRERKHMYKKIKLITNDIKGLKKDIASNEANIKILNLDIQHKNDSKLLFESKKDNGLFIPIAQLKNNMLALYQGYMQFVNNALTSDKIKQCTEIFNEEYAKAEQEEAAVVQYKAA